MTGDGDHVAAIKVVKDEGIKIHLFHSADRSQLSDELFKVCDTRKYLSKEYLDHFLKKCLRANKS